MDKETKQEILLRTLKLDGYEAEKLRLDTVELGLGRLFVQTHEMIDGRRVKLTKRRKVAKGNALIGRVMSADIDIASDAINQIRALDA